MNTPSFYISSAIVNVDTSLTKKIVFLPVASTVRGKTFWVHDLSGTANTNSIVVSTIGMDTIDYSYGFNTSNVNLELINQYVTYRFIAQNNTNYSIINSALTNNAWPPP